MEIHRHRKHSCRSGNPLHVPSQADGLAADVGTRISMETTASASNLSSGDTSRLKRPGGETKRRRLYHEVTLVTRTWQLEILPLFQLVVCNACETSLMLIVKLSTREIESIQRRQPTLYLLHQQPSSCEPVKL